MSRIDFYMLDSTDARSRWLMACRLVEKAYSQGYRVYLYAASEADSQALNDLLWTFRQGSFVPHERVTTLPVDSAVPVLVGHVEATGGFGDVLVNLTAQIPEGYDRYARVLELIDQNQDIRQQGRIRYRAYKSAGHQLFDHDLSKQEDR